MIRHTAANGLPLGAEVKDKFRKVALLDVGLLHALLATPAEQAFPRWEALAPAGDPLYLCWNLAQIVATRSSGQ